MKMERRLLGIDEKRLLIMRCITIVIVMLVLCFVIILNVEHRLIKDLITTVLSNVQSIMTGLFGIVTGAALQGLRRNSDPSPKGGESLIDYHTSMIRSGSRIGCVISGRSFIKAGVPCRDC